MFYIAGVASYLPPVVTIARALESRWYDSGRAAEDRLTSVTVEPELSPPDMAVRAGRLALERSRHRAEDIALLLHATVYRQGPEIWPAASYVERFAVGNAAPAIEILQGCNGGLAALELAMGHLGGDPGRTAAMITTADRWNGDMDRWRSDVGILWGDAATAVVVSRQGGIAGIRALVTRTDPTLEDMHRGSEPLPVAAANRGHIDLVARKKAYLAQAGIGHFVDRFSAGLVDTVDQALKEAGLTKDDLAAVVLPHLGRKIIDREYLAPLGLPIERTTWPHGSHIGHTGAGDQFIGLEHLLTRGDVGVGDQVLLIGVGIGFTWCAAVVELTDRKGLPE
jgi:3-oxoacyl-[acyl-carrier-protein] synthase-3